MFNNLKITDEKEFILRLIKDDLLNVRLVTGLLALGLKDAGDYHLHLSQTIFSLIGYEIGSVHEEKVFEEYCEISQRVMGIDIFEQPEKFDEFVNELYNKLKTDLKLQNFKPREGKTDKNDTKAFSG
jgi:hypothetical protein